MTRWALLYHDGRIVRGDGSDVVALEVPRAWLEAPSDGVIALAVEHPEVGRMILEGPDAFYWMTGPHPGAGEPGAADRLGAFLRALGVVKFGIWTRSADYQGRLRAFRDEIAEFIPPIRPPSANLERATGSRRESPED